MKSGLECYKCGQLGHIARLCKRSGDEYYEETQTCYRCHRRGHFARECGKYSAQSIQCFRCQGFGHIAKNCTVVAYNFQRNDVKNSAANYQFSSRSTKRGSQPRNLSYTVAAPQRVSQAIAMPSTQICKGAVRKQKNGTTVIRSTSHRSNQIANLEALANELLLGLFEYLSTAHLLCAFGGLNSRFDTLLFAHFRACHLDFRSVSKHDCGMICRRYFPLIKDRIISLRLSDATSDFKQTNHLASNGITLRQFSNLRSLSLCHIRSKQVMEDMMIEWLHLHNLTHLKLIKCYSSFQNTTTLQLSNTIWSLPKLTHCCLDTEHYNFCKPTKISLSIQCVSLLGYYCRLNELALLLKKTPCLRSLSIRHRDINDEQYFLSHIPSITSMKLYEIRSPPVLRNLLQNMINLTHLTVETFYINLDGYQWEQIIIHHLTKLRVFRLKMAIQFVGKMNNEQQADTLLDSFRSRFWLEEHQWFVRCHRRPQKDYSDILLYTLPLTFRDFDMTTLRFPYKSTNPYNINY